MNSPIRRIFVLILVLFGLLVYFTSKWAVFDSDELQANSLNRRPLIASQQIPRGSITTSDGVLIAESKPQGGGNHPVYIRDYPEDDPTAFGNPVGYSYVNIEQTGIERSENDLLTGQKNEFASIIDQLQNQEPQGADITVTLDAQAQRLAVSLLQQAIASTPGSNGAGSVVAIEPQTGAVRVMASIPGFDPNAVQNENTFEQLSNDETAPLFNRPTQATYQPGSTMKVVTAAAALDSGQFTPDSVLSGHSPQTIGGVPLSNAGGEEFGDIDMDTALTHSVNVYFAQVGEKLGTQTMFEYMNRFGFDSDPELDYPDGQMAPSGVYDDNGHLLGSSDAIDIGRVAIGQERLLVTPIQMAEVAAAVANDGKLMKPTFLQKATDPDGRTIDELDPSEQDQVVSADTASELTTMMTHVTEEGTAAGLTVQGASFAGKTGTAEIDPAAGTNRPWFIGFAPAADPKIAVAVMLETCDGCFGGEVAGPIATQVMDDLIGG
ncbi:MAG: peptidoglycan D,D-transpeptidase FtsI family protein [Solirubrobacterales bacterium]